METDEPPISRSVKSKANALGLGRKKKDPKPVLPTHEDANHNNGNGNGSTHAPSNTTLAEKQADNTSARGSSGTVKSSASTSPAPPATEGETASPVGPKVPMATRIKNGTKRFGSHTKKAILHSWINLLLVFVPIGIAAHAANLSPAIVFSMNAIAIIPLAGMLAHATEAVATRLGDTLGALLNVSFGNAVELILFIILLAANQIEVVQAALLGSILANLLLILGMAFLLGGLRYQEQLYNSTVTQMSACMLSLAVMSLLLPTAFHAAFQNNAIADKETLQVSRGTSVVLLLVYVLFLVFQLKSHTYMYASTPQHIIDEESHPGVMAEIFNSSSESSSDSSSSDSDGSSAGSHTTAKSKIKRKFRKLRRKSSASLKDKESPSVPSVMTSPSVEQHRNYFDMKRKGSDEHAVEEGVVARRGSDPLGAILSGDEADDDDIYAPVARDFEVGSAASAPGTTKHEKRKQKKKHRKTGSKDLNEKRERARQQSEVATKVAFAEEVQQDQVASVTKRPIYRPAFSLLSNNVFVNPTPAPVGTPAPNIRVAAPRTLRRTRSEPENIRRLDSQSSAAGRPAPVRAISNAPSVHAAAPEEEEEEVMSRTAAVMLLLISTALVAVCADFMSDAIEPMVDSTGISQAFIGLIILPIVGNAAEHVTAVTVAMKNKMDLSIGIAVGSSIQIAIFVTPFIVLLGWIMGKPMTLYFNIFETVALFVTTFIINFLVLDGRSNYLEGSLLIAAYIIIALASFFYPDGCDASKIGGSEEAKCGTSTSVAEVAAVQAATLVKRMAGF
ncbi:calcium/proton exchanger [Massarina eburnea CBS 473.64]|uniref:Calcium/proton exchanger n=1 Tax=Massarina eburnea CBS 473.64 TaxID=1395130 RepID=A0A6A6RIB6_9PLEO|nr:calcium/proton exchanger [Massarina eburnea CBS 473.64]